MKTIIGLLAASFLLTADSAFALGFFQKISSDASPFYDIDPSSLKIEPIEEDPEITAKAIADYKSKILLKKREQINQKKLQINQLNLENQKEISGQRSEINMDAVNQTLDKVEVATDTIIRTGTKIWNVVEAGKPVINLKSKSANAIPQGITNWYELENWKAPRSQTYRITYKNKFGMTAVDFSFRLIFMYGGSYKGQGQYIANAQILPVNIYTSWLYDFDVQSEISEVFNAGTTENPIASMQLFINWQVGVIQSIQKVETFYITGEGQLIKND